MSKQDDEYLYRRAEAEMEMAQNASSVEAVRAHVELAEAYLDKLHGTENAIAVPAASLSTPEPSLNSGASLAEEQAQQQAGGRAARSPTSNPAMPLLRN